ncbi:MULTISPECIES: hypothetical protein [Paraburkholderia]|jgi:hypothetical protein|uniref:Uncharacterized protein n=2 Tax=Paraburkholderia TaxID=1822464 RepID=A0ABN7LJV8_9BURK|nr:MULTISPECIES: hypothetical protein [Paraburkholderia]MBK5150465.1 hypothetical protein [Burkholderia sp. R-69608]CAE6702186.1 hypothetical protein LMG22931_00841 [Paraburkholderia nemoris]CAE6737891.1 hypothetical protein R75777_02382 [Paraburkholderia nemoris]CAE6745414.1 hypothetical protein R69658_02458 [Paraburkholderia aspalathi]CAE6767724.1 hypothetical protein R69776_03686 [Paraburkholderia nemoris]
MIQMMMSAIGGSPAARGKQRHYASTLRKAVGFAIFSSGLVVIVAQAVQHALGA